MRFEFVGLGAQLRVGQFFEFRFERVDLFFNDHPRFLDGFLARVASDFGIQILEHWIRNLFLVWDL